MNTVVIFSTFYYNSYTQVSELCRPYTLNMVEGETVAAGTGMLVSPQKQDHLVLMLKSCT